jgi:hypothetical protein
MHSMASWGSCPSEKQGMIRVAPERVGGEDGESGRKEGRAGMRVRKAEMERGWESSKSSQRIVTVKMSL